MSMQERDEMLADIEYELTLLSRHQLRTHQQLGQDLDRSGYLLLSRLELERSLSLKELAAAFHLDVSTIHRQVGALLRAELVEYVLDKDGGVARKIQPTPKGLGRLRDVRERYCSSIGRVVDGWRADDLDSLHALLLRFNRGVERIEGEEWPRPSRETSASADVVDHH
jgi:DNA-binding MarR family transcriptional regulator